MKMLMIVLVFLATGCSVLYPEAGIMEGWRERRMSWVRDNSSRLSPEVAEAIRNGDVIPGMTLEEAYMAWMDVAPGRVNRMTTDAGTVEQYIFEETYGYGMKFFYMENGRVTAVQD